MMRACLVLAAMLACFNLAAIAQTQPTGPDKKMDTVKGKEIEPGKGKGKEPGKNKTDDTGKDLPTPKIPLDKLKTPADAIVVVVDKLLDALAIFPEIVALSPEQYQALKAEIKALKEQLKVEEVLPSFCKLQGKLDGDYLALKADFLFATDQPKATVFLGMLGGHLDTGALDGQPPILEAIEKKGFVVRVEKEGTHQLTLHLRVRVDVKKSSAAGTERSVELGLPNAAGGNLQLNLPGNVKEFRSNEELEKPKSPGLWVVPIGRSKLLKLSWKEPIALTGNTPLYEVDTQVNVRIDETHANVKADLHIKDLRAPSKEWQLLLPAGAKADAIAPGGQIYPLIPPDDGNPYHAFKMPPVGGDRWQIAVSMRMPRPSAGSRLPIGPFIVLGAVPQLVTLNVQMPAEKSLGQRLVYHRQNDVSQVKNAESEAVFQYSIAPDNNPAPHAPLELEWRLDKNLLETQVKHALKWTTLPLGWQLDVETRIEVKTIFAGTSAIDLRLPLPRQRGVSLAGTVMPGVSYPGGIPWAGMWGDPVTDKPAVFDDLGNPLEASAPDFLGKTRVVWGSPAKKLTLVLQNTYRVPAVDRRLRIELPRPLNTQDRGAKLTIQADDRLELLHGPRGAEEAVPERHRFNLSWNQAPAKIDLAWQPHRHEVTADSIVDIVIREYSAEVRQTISFPWEPGAMSGSDPKQTQVRLVAPRSIDKVTLSSGGKITSKDFAKQTIWVQPSTDPGDKVELVLQFDLPIGKKALDNKNPSAQLLNVPLVWPANVSRKEVKVRCWSHAGGVKIRLTDDLGSRGLWKQRGIEQVKGKDTFPVLVLQAAAAQVPLALMVEDAASSLSAALLADRGLIQMTMCDDGSQQCRARFWIRKLNSDHVDVVLPFPLARFRGAPTFSLVGIQLTDWQPANPADDKTIRLKISPDVITLPGVLEVQYTIPADAFDRNTSWRTTLEVPTFRSEAAVGNLRWQVSLPTAMIPATFGRPIRVDTHWTVQGWLLTPELNGNDLENWLTGKDAPPTPAPVTFAFAHPHLQPLTIYHLPRQWWLLGCSGILLILTLGVYFSPAPRVVFALFLLALSIGLLVLAILSPATLPPVLFGCQPGVLVLAIFLTAHWIVQERNRRELVLLPAFSRAKPTSTVTMPAAKRPREPSTVDSPAAPDGGPTPTPTPSTTGSSAGS